MAKLVVPLSDKDHIQGNGSAKITLVEYADYECSQCGKAFHLIKQLQKHFGDNLRFAYRHFPLIDKHPHAEIAAETAEFAASHQKFWQMHDLLFENQQRLDVTLLIELAQSLKLPIQELKNNLVARPYHEKIRQDILGGTHCGVAKTPTLFINDELYTGEMHFKACVKAMSAFLS